METGAPGRRELARRVDGAIEITLYWYPDEDTTSIEVRHVVTDETVSFAVARDRALDAFRHPFVHLGSGALPGTRPRRR
jgi:hypothetical protein